MKKAVTTFLLLTAFIYLYGNQTIKTMQSTEEIWKSITGYEGYYEISNRGRVKSVQRTFYNKLTNSYILVCEKIMSTCMSAEYVAVCLNKDGGKRTKKIHQLVAIAFKGHIPNGHKDVINHKDLDKTNNNDWNLEIVPNRVNSNKKHIPHSSKYTGVFWDTESGKWRARIGHKGKQKSLGRFDNEYIAHLAYETALKALS